MQVLHGNGSCSVSAQAMRNVSQDCLWIAGPRSISLSLTCSVLLGVFACLSKSRQGNNIDVAEAAPAAGPVSTRLGLGPLGVFLAGPAGRCVTIGC